jgi:hypothetical protein
MPARRYLQRPATCKISMANTGTAPAKSVELATQLPAGVKFVRANNAGYLRRARRTACSGTSRNCRRAKWHAWNSW